MTTKERFHDLLELREELHLPDRISLISNYDLVNFIKTMENPDYSTMLMESFVNHKRIAKVMKDNPQIFCASPYSYFKSAIHQLRRDIIVSFTEKEDLSVQRFVDTAVLRRLGIHDIPVKDAIKMIEGMEYRQSKDMDRLILGLFNNGFIVDYPLFLLKDPIFPFNLYGDYLGNSGILYRNTVKELYKKYIHQIAHIPLYTFKNYMINSQFIFNTRFQMLTDRQKFIGILFYKEKMRIPDISEEMGISESNIKNEIHAILKTLNTEEGKCFIHTGSNA